MRRIYLDCGFQETTRYRCKIGVAVSEYDHYCDLFFCAGQYLMIEGYLHRLLGDVEVAVAVVVSYEVVRPALIEVLFLARKHAPHCVNVLKYN